MQQVHVTTSVAELLGRTAQRGPVSMLRHSQRCATLQQPRRVCRRSSVRPPVLAAYAATAVAAPGIDTVTAAARNAGGFFPPPLLVKPDEAALRANRPFLTTDAGMLPVLPRNLGHALFNYDGYSSKYISVRVDNVHVKLRSYEHAVTELRGAEAALTPYWCSLVEQVAHPGWWPAQGHVPNYDQVIFGRGNASIGLHWDKDNACAGGSRSPVSTYLAICAGAKLCLLLPPDQTLLPAGGDADMLLQPSVALLEDVRAAGGHYFLLHDQTDAVDAAAGNSGFSATALYLPAGWWHWLVGLTDWHVVYGGSFFPQQQPWLPPGAMDAVAHLRAA